MLKDDKYWHGVYESLVSIQMNRLIPKDKTEEYPHLTYKGASKKLWELDKRICAAFGVEQGKDGHWQAPGESYRKWADHMHLHNLDTWEAIEQDLNTRFGHEDADSRAWYAARGADPDDRLAGLLKIADWLKERYSLKQNEKGKSNWKLN